MFGGIDIIVADSMFPDTRVQVRFPRSKRKRIRRKWAKDQRNWRVQKGRGGYMIGRQIFCDSVTYARYQELVQQMEKNWPAMAHEVAGAPWWGL